MTKIKIGKKEYKIFYAMQPTVQSGVLRTLAKIENEKDWSIENFDNLLVGMTELLLIGLQKFHGDEFGFNYATGEGKDEAMAKAYALMDDFATESNEEDTYFDMYAKLQSELLENGFFAKLFQKEQEKAAKEKK